MCLLLFVLAIIYFNAALVSFKVDHAWILNTIDDCLNDDSYEYRMGIDFTFEDTAVLFSIIGAGFGASTATQKLENILWSETPTWKRIIRGLIGSAVVIGIFMLSKLIPHEDHPTRYFFQNLAPHLIAAYCAYGLVPIFSKYIGLSSKTNELEITQSRTASIREITEQDESSGENNEAEQELPENSERKINEGLLYK